MRLVLLRQRLRVSSPNKSFDASKVDGATVVDVQTIGKNLFVTFLKDKDPVTVRMHFDMSGALRLSVARYFQMFRCFAKTRVPKSRYQCFNVCSQGSDNLSRGVEQQLRELNIFAVMCTGKTRRKAESSMPKKIQCSKVSFFPKR